MPSLTLQIRILNNRNLASVGAAFPNLANVGGALTISGSTGLGTSTGPDAFASLTSVGGVTLQTPFSAQTDIYVGDITSGSIASIASMLSGKQVGVLSSRKSAAPRSHALIRTPPLPRCLSMHTHKRKRNRSIILHCPHLHLVP